MAICRAVEAELTGIRKLLRIEVADIIGAHDPVALLDFNAANFVILQYKTC
jgi:hypothetical protein